MISKMINCTLCIALRFSNMTFQKVDVFRHQITGVGGSTPEAESFIGCLLSINIPLRLPDRSRSSSQNVVFEIAEDDI
jgi:hypothetical protein